MDITNAKNWMLLPPGSKAICRFPLQMTVNEILQQCGNSIVSVAGLQDVLAANQGAPFPWGYYPDDSKAAKLWKNHRVGYGGLIHNNWFITKDGRVGGASNVITTGPGALRHCLLLDGGGVKDSELPNLSPPEDNEGYGVVAETTEATREMYRKVQLFAAKYVVADRGAVIVSPISNDGIVYCGFVGRCQICPSAELISYEQLKISVPEYEFELWDEWKSWKV